MSSKIAETIQHYLYFNYLPRKKDLSWLEAPLSKRQASFDYTPCGAALAFEGAVDRLLDRVEANGYVVVPISGGWDSRILLGSALERFDSAQIKTVSFGTPGLLDYDLGAKMSEALGLEHHAVDLSKVELSWEALKGFATQAPWTYCIEGFYNPYSIAQVARSEKDIVLSGFMGEALTGGHLSYAKTKEAAIREFVLKQRREKTLALTRVGYDPRAALPDIPEYSRIPHSELLDLGVRQPDCIAPCVTPERSMRQWDGLMGRMSTTNALVLTPFSEPSWAAYWLSAPQAVKVGQRLYRSMMEFRYPQVARFPSKYTLGVHPANKIAYYSRRMEHRVKAYLARRLRSFAYVSPALNYVDFASAFRHREDYRCVLEEAMTYLRDKDVVPWLDLRRIASAHMEEARSLESALMILVGLAINHAAHCTDLGGQVDG